MATETKVNPNHILNIPLSDIFVDPTWNTRSGVGNSSSGGSNDENTDAGLVESIKARGQDQEVLLRPTPKEFKVKQPYMLVYGFRRHWAVTQIATETGNLKTATIKARIEEMTETQARAKNLGENTARENLGAADICFGIARILEVEPTMPSTAVAQEIGLNQSYVAQHMRILAGVKKSILQKWRDQTGKKVTVAEMEKLAKLQTAGEQEKAFNEASGKDAGEGSEKGPNAWKDASKKKMAKLGTFFGSLAREGYLSIDPETFFLDALPLLVKVSGGKGNKQASDREMQGFAEAGYKAFHAEMEREEVAEKAEADRVEGNAKEKAKNGGKGKTVSAN